MRSRICSSSLLGCQPTLSQLAEIWELALRGIENHERKVSLTHLVGEKERITSQDLDELVQEAGSPDALSNLTLSGIQDNPHREVLIQVGPGRSTSVTIEAEDHTWAIGRHTEVMEKLNNTRRWYAPGDPVKFASWPERKKAPPFTLKRAVLGPIYVVLAAAAALLSLAVVEIYVGLIIEPTYLVVKNISHHRVIQFGGILLEFVSLTVICITVYAVIKVLMASKSKVVIRRERVWTTNRIALVGILAGVVAAIASVLALFK